MYRIFLAHLTTTIVKIDIHVKENRTIRKTVTDFKCFEHLQNKVHPAKSNKKAKESQQEVTLSDNHKNMLHDVFRALKWSSDDFVAHYNKAFILITKPIKDEDRISDEMLTRILICSGLRRNYGSSNRNRDWGKIALAAVLETAIVHGYRETLLNKCPSANRLRRDLGEYLFSKFSGIERPSSSRKAGTVLTDWVFADGLPIPKKTDEELMGFTDPKSLKSEWERASNAETTLSNDPIAKIVHMLETNKYLTCSSDDVEPGSVETLAHNLITGLIHVCHDLSSLFAHMAATSLVQIMSRNKARLDFDKDNNDDKYDFVMSEITVPDIPRKPHSISEQYQKDVSLILICHYQTHHNIIQLGYDQWVFNPSSQSDDTSSLVRFGISCPYFSLIPFDRTINQIVMIAVCPALFLFSFVLFYTRCRFTVVDTPASAHTLYSMRGFIAPWGTRATARTFSSLCGFIAPWGVSASHVTAVVIILSPLKQSLSFQTKFYTLYL